MLAFLGELGTDASALRQVRRQGGRIVLCLLLTVLTGVLWLLESNH